MSEEEDLDKKSKEPADKHEKQASIMTATEHWTLTHCTTHYELRDLCIDYTDAHENGSKN